MNKQSRRKIARLNHPPGSSPRRKFVKRDDKKKEDRTPTGPSMMEQAIMFGSRPSRTLEAKAYRQFLFEKYGRQV